MLAVRHITALLITTLAKWIEPLYGNTSERFAKAFFWMLASFNVVSILLLLAPTALRRYVTLEMRGLNVLVVVAVWLLMSVLLFGGHSIGALAAEARSRWPVIARRENWVAAMYCTVTAAVFVFAILVCTRRI